MLTRKVGLDVTQRVPTSIRLSNFVKVITHTFLTKEYL